MSGIRSALQSRSARLVLVLLLSAAACVAMACESKKADQGEKKTEEKAEKAEEKTEDKTEEKAEEKTEEKTAPEAGAKTEDSGAQGAATAEAAPDGTAEVAPDGSAESGTLPAAPQNALLAAAQARPEIAFAPAPQTVAGKTVEATLCEYDGELLLSEHSVTTTAVGDIAWAPDGKLYVIDHTQAIRRYTVAPGEGCKLVLDKSFGSDGLLRMERPGQFGSDDPMPTPWLTAGSMTVDDQGRLFVAPDAVWTDGSWRITDGKVDYFCADNSGKLSVTPDGSTGFSIEADVEKATFGDGGCTVEKWTPQDIVEDEINDVYVLGDTVWVSAYNAKELHAYDLDGKPKGVTLGNRELGLSEPGNICSAYAIEPGALGLTVVDYNCRALVFFEPDGKFLDRLDVSRMLNPDAYLYPTFAGFTAIRDGSAFLTLAIERGKTGDEGNPHQGFILRLTGL